MQIVSLEAANKLGLKRYYTGLKCSKGHDSERYAALRKYDKVGKCCMCVKEHQRAHYNRKSDAREQDRPRPASCEVCGSTNGKERLAWDHCHTTGRFRGWLCKQCNVALGLVKDNPNTLIKLSSYLIASMQKALIPKPRPS